MRIGIDVRSLEGGAGHRGIGRYVTSLLTALSHIDHENEYVLLLTGRHTEPPKLDFNKAFKYEFRQGHGPGLRALKYIRIFRLLPRPLPVDNYSLDVMMQVDPWQRVKASKTPLVCTIHDLIPFKFKDIYQHVHFGGFGPKSLIGYVRMRLQWKAAEYDLQAYRKCRKIVSISNHTKADLLEWVPKLDPNTIKIVPLAADQIVTPPKAASKHLRELGLANFLFYVGGADPRKGLIGLTKSLEKVWEKYPDTQLVIAGKEFLNPEVGEAVKLHKVITKLSRPGNIILPGFISDAELAWLYEHAAAFVFPSRYEGFGLPVLEAMQAGCPVIAYRNSSIPEVAGEAAVLVPDGDSMVPAITKVLSDPQLRAKLSKQGKAQAAKFSWEKTARETLAVLEEAATSV